MKALLVTVAGMSTRFSKSIGKECLKCIYSDESIENSLLYRMLQQPVEFDRYIIVGGYKFDELKAAIDMHFTAWKDRIVLVENEHFHDYGSGYSLFCGLQKAVEIGCDQVVFAEGDLFLDEASFVLAANSDKNVITCNKEAIYANKAVAFYFDTKDRIHYIYDTGHSALVINEPFKSIFNSGQVWKFSDKDLMRSTLEELSETEWQGTNLVFVERYFGKLNPNDMEVIFFERWINCNTVADYKKI